MGCKGIECRAIAEVFGLLKEVNRIKNDKYNQNYENLDLIEFWKTG